MLTDFILETLKQRNNSSKLRYLLFLSLVILLVTNLIFPQQYHQILGLIQKDIPGISTYINSFFIVSFVFTLIIYILWVGFLIGYYAIKPFKSSSVYYKKFLGVQLACNNIFAWFLTMLGLLYLFDSVKFLLYISTIWQIVTTHMILVIPGAWYILYLIIGFCTSVAGTFDFVVAFKPIQEYTDSEKN